ncbi:helix-turn-helix domain-containing protein [Paenibacillus chitinolyticus]|uniref:helix-turn-helix domain-containing protein n=1 Tax=Paenibacillus chitinolyticus TaxID=79263 RepID=UPI0036DA2405
MEYYISSVKTKEIIAPRCNFEFTSDGQLSMLLVLKGSLLIEWRKKKRTVTEGNIVFGEKLKLRNIGADIASVFALSFSETLLLNKEMIKKPDYFNVYSTNVEPLFSEITKVLSKESNPNQLYIDFERLLPTFLKLIFQSEKEKQQTCKRTLSGKIDPRLIRINRYIRENYYKALTLQSLADLIQCNPVYLSNTYSKVFQITPIKYLQDIRMSKAKELIIRTNKSISTIANQLGYISNSQFTNLFKRYFNMTPTEFRITTLNDAKKY